MKTKLPFALCLALLLPGCVPSVNPLYTSKDLVFDPALVGVWSEENDKETWSFQKAGEKKYLLKHTDDEGQVGEFDAHLLKLGKQLFLDLRVLDPGAKDDDLSMNNWARWTLIIRPGHLFLKVDQISPELQMRVMDPDALEKLLEKNPKAVRHERIRFDPRDDDDKGQIVLTAETKDLQKFILKHMNDEKLFGEPSNLRKRDAGKPGE
jgi:hypothetical protein